MAKNILERIEFLRGEVLFHDEMYDKGTPVITDTEYDKLYAELVQLERDNPEYFDESSPTQKIVSEIVEGLNKVIHTTPMLSQDKVHNAEDLRKFCSKADIKDGIIVQYKLDGLTIVEKYNNQLFTQGVTRGDGYVGEDITHTSRYAKGLPLKIDFEGNLEVRGEAIINFENFEKANVNGEYKSPRNLASGTVRTLDSSKAKERGLQVISYDVVNAEGMDFKLDTEMLEFLKKQGFDVVPYKVFYDVEELIEYCTTFNEKVRPTIPYMIDGLVLKFNNLELREELGYTSKYPRWGCAFKFESLDATTKLINVDWQVSKTGKLTPVGVVEPVEIDGVTIGKASLANIDNIRLRDIKLNDTVLIRRANDVIPQIVSPVKELRDSTEIEIKAPNNCPVCNHPIAEEVNKESGNTTYFCYGINCTAQVERKIQHFVSRNCLNIDGLGDSTVSLFTANNLLSSITDIYALKDKVDVIKTFEGMGDRKISKMLKGIETSKKAPLSKVLYGLSINNIGESGANDLAKEFISMRNILDTPTEELKDKVSKIKDFGEVCSNSFAEYFSDSYNRAIIENLLSLGLTMEEEVKAVTESNITGKTFVITGTLSIGRSDMKKKIESFGGKVSGSVSKKTDYLLMGAGEEGSSKHNKALELGVNIISEEDLNNMI